MSTTLVVDIVLYGLLQGMSNSVSEMILLMLGDWFGRECHGESSAEILN